MRDADFMWMSLICPVYSQLNSQSGKMPFFMNTLNICTLESRAAKTKLDRK